MAMTIRPDPQMQRALDAMAEATKRSRNEILHDAVMEKWERDLYLTQVDEAAAEMTERWGNVLDRLGQA